jgi:hypothetical protein
VGSQYNCVSPPRETLRILWEGYRASLVCEYSERHLSIGHSVTPPTSQRPGRDKCRQHRTLRNKHLQSAYIRVSSLDLPAGWVLSLSLAAAAQEQQAGIQWLKTSASSLCTWRQTVGLAHLDFIASSTRQAQDLHLQLGKPELVIHSSSPWPFGTLFV